MSKKLLFALLALMFSTVAFAQHDQYGKWQFEDAELARVFWLKSESCNPNGSQYGPTTLTITSPKDDPMLFLTLTLKKNSVASRTEKIDDFDDDASKHEVMELELSFDNGDYGYFKFAYDYQIVEYNDYTYLTTDRFRRTYNYDATSIIKQMANKRTLRVRYKLTNGTTETETFNLEGLDAILELLNK